MQNNFDKKQSSLKNIPFMEKRKNYQRREKYIIDFENKIENFSKSHFEVLPFPIFDKYDFTDERFYDYKTSSLELVQSVMDSAYENRNLLIAGRDGIIKGFKEVEKMWGEEQSEIAKKILMLSLEIMEVEIKQVKELKRPIVQNLL